MNVLLIISTSSMLSTCLLRCGDDMIISSTDGLQGHAEVLPGLVGDLLQRMSRSFSDITHIICDVGPGSFTGIRTGISYISGIVAAKSGILVAPMNMLDVMMTIASNNDLIAVQSPNGMFYIKDDGQYKLAGKDFFTLYSTKRIYALCNYKNIAYDNIVKLSVEDIVIRQDELKKSVKWIMQEPLVPCYVNGFNEKSIESK